MTRTARTLTVAATLGSFGAGLSPLTVAHAAPPGPTIVDVAIQANSVGPFAGQLDTLIAAVLAADPSVYETLNGNGQFTVFAPTDDAFAALGLDPNNVADLGPDALRDILLYHGSRGRRMANSVVTANRIRMLFPGFVRVDGTELIDNLGGAVNIVATDVKAANGVVHVVDGVLLPFAP